MDPDRLDGFADLLRSHAIPAGFVAASDASRLWERHVEDSLRATEAVRATMGSVADLGSGAGLPGIPLAIALPERRFLLVEAQRRRVAFLELAIERLGLTNVEVRHGRAEEVAEASAGAVTARAFAPLERAWAVARRILQPGGSFVYFAGGSMEDPLAEARRVAGSEAQARLLESAPPLVIMTRR